MKTTFMQQIIAIAIFSASITCTSGTPLPASLRLARDIPPFLPIDFEPVTDYAPHYRESLTEVSSTESDVPHYLIAPRVYDFEHEPNPPKPGTMMQIAGVLVVEVNNHDKANPPIWQNLKKLEYFLETTLEAYRTVHDGSHNDVNEPGLSDLVHHLSFAVTYASQDLDNAFRKKAEAGITEETGTPLIEQLIKLAHLSIYRGYGNAGHDLADVVGITVNAIMEQNLGWPIIDGLKKAQTDLKNKWNLRKATWENANPSHGGGGGHA